MLFYMFLHENDIKSSLMQTTDSVLFVYKVLPDNNNKKTHTLFWTTYLNAEIYFSNLKTCTSIFVYFLRFQYYCPLLKSSRYLLRPEEHPACVCNNFNKCCKARVLNTWYVWDRIRGTIEVNIEERALNRFLFV